MKPDKNKNRSLFNDIDSSEKALDESDPDSLIDLMHKSSPMFGYSKLRAPDKILTSNLIKAQDPK